MTVKGSALHKTQKSQQEGGVTLLHILLNDSLIDVNLHRQNTELGYTSLYPDVFLFFVFLLFSSKIFSMLQYNILNMYTQTNGALNTQSPHSELLIH